MKRYQQLAEQMRDQIRAGVLRPGDRIPSVRQVRRSRKINPATVTQAYRLLEDRGLVIARPRSGYYVSPNWAGLRREPEVTSPPRAASGVDVIDIVFDILESVREPSIVPFGSAFIDASVYPLQKLARYMGAAARRVAPRRMADTLPPGLIELRRAIARRYLDCGVTVRPEEVVITAGGLEALWLSVRAVARPGDLIAIESPAFYSELQIIQLLGMRVVEIPTSSRDGMELSALSAALARHPIKACWLMTNFQNPLGSTMPEENKKDLVKLLARHDVPLIEDDVYDELYFGTAKPRPAKAFDRSGMVLHCSSFSKCLAPGYRVGWASAGRFSTEVQWVKLMTTLGTNIAAQAAIAEYVRHGSYDHYLRGLRRTLQAGRDEMMRAIVQYFPAGTRFSRPQGGYFLWVELPRRVNALELARVARENGISVAPGPIFSARQKFTNFVRLNYGHPWGARHDKAMQSLGRIVASLL